MDHVTPTQRGVEQAQRGFHDRLLVQQLRVAAATGAEGRQVVVKIHFERKGLACRFGIRQDHGFHIYSGWGSCIEYDWGSLVD